MDARYMIDTTTYNKLHGAPLKMQHGRKELDATSVESEKPPQHSFLLLLPTEIRGFSLLTKKWGK